MADEQNAEVWTKFESAPNGPLTSSQTATQTIAVDANGLTVAIGVSNSITDEQLQAGIPITLNGESIGHLVQGSYAMLQANKKIDVHLEPGSPYLPEGLYFRVRGFGKLSLESSDGTWLIQKRFKPKFRPGASDTLVCLFATVDRTLRGVMSSDGLI